MAFQRRKQALAASTKSCKDSKSSQCACITKCRNITDDADAVVTALNAICALFPLKWQADVRERGAELTFCVGGRLVYCRRNDTRAAGHSAGATAMQFVHAAAL